MQRLHAFEMVTFYNYMLHSSKFSQINARCDISWECEPLPCACSHQRFTDQLILCYDKFSEETYKRTPQLTNPFMLQWLLQSYNVLLNIN